MGYRDQQSSSERTFSIWKLLTDSGEQTTVTAYSLSQGSKMQSVLAPPIEVVSAPAIVEPKRYWDLSVVSTQALWILQISIEKGVSDKLNVEHQHLGLSSEEAFRLKKDDRVDEIKISAFTKLNTAYNKLIGRRKKLQNTYLQCNNGVWFALDSEKGVIQDHIDSMKLEAQKCLGLVPRDPDDDGFVLTDAEYEAGQEEYCDRIYSAILKLSNGRLTDTEVRELIDSDSLSEGRPGYRYRFPDLDLIRQSFGVGAAWLYKIESLQESALHHTEIERALSEYTEARKHREVSEAELAIERQRIIDEVRIQNETTRMLRDTCAGLVKKVQGDLLSQIQNNLDVLQKIQDGQLVKSNTRQKMHDTLELINRMSGFAKSLHNMGLDDMPEDLKTAIALLNETQNGEMTLQFNGVAAQIKEIQASLDRARGVVPDLGHDTLAMDGVVW